MRSREMLTAEGVAVLLVLPIVGAVLLSLVVRALTQVALSRRVLKGEPLSQSMLRPHRL